jgi:hypothetical protein
VREGLLFGRGIGRRYGVPPYRHLCASRSTLLSWFGPQNLYRPTVKEGGNDVRDVCFWLGECLFNGLKIIGCTGFGEAINDGVVGYGTELRPVFSETPPVPRQEPVLDLRLGASRGRRSSEAVATWTPIKVGV